MQLLLAQAGQAEAGDRTGGIIWLGIILILVVMLALGFRKADRFTKAVIAIAVPLMAVVIIIGWRAIF